MRTWLRRSIAACVVSVLGILGIQTGAQSSRLLTNARVDAMFKAWSPPTPGCATGVAVKGEPVVRAAYGMADLEDDEPNTPETVFEAGLGVEAVHGDGGDAAGSAFHPAGRFAAVEQPMR